MGKNKDLILTLEKIDSQVSIGSKWFDERDEIISLIEKIDKVDNDEEYEKATVLLKRVTKFYSDSEKRRKEVTGPFTKAAKEIKAIFDQEANVLLDSKSSIKDIATKYLDKVEAERIEAERERQKKEQEEAMRLVSEQQEKEELFGESESEEIKISSLEPAVIPVPPKSSSARVSKTIKFETTEKLDDNFKCPDTKKINEWVRDNKDALNARLELATEDNPIEMHGMKLWLANSLSGR